MDVTENLQVLSQNPDGTFTVRLNRPAESTALTAPQANFAVRINGTVVNFASEADFRNAQAALNGAGYSGGIPEVNTRRGASSGGGGFLRTATDAAETVNSAFEVRNAKAREREYKDLATALADARQKIAAQSASNPALVAGMLEFLDTFGDAVAITIQNLEDDVTSAWVRTGIGAARTVSDFSASSGRYSSGQDNGVGQSLLVGGLALGGGLLLADALGSSSRRGRFQRS